MLNSFKANKKGIILMLFSSFCVCLGQLFWKLSNVSFWLLLLGFLLYGVGALLMLIAYKYGSLSVLQPMLSFNYVFSLALAHFALNEEITVSGVIGIVIIIAGTVLIGGGDD